MIFDSVTDFCITVPLEHQIFVFTSNITITQVLQQSKYFKIIWVAWYFQESQVKWKKYDYDKAMHETMQDEKIKLKRLGKSSKLRQ